MQASGGGGGGGRARARGKQLPKFDDDDVKSVAGSDVGSLRDMWQRKDADVSKKRSELRRAQSERVERVAQGMTRGSLACELSLGPTSFSGCAPMPKREVH